MGVVGDGLQFGFDLFLVCISITIGGICGSMLNQVAQASATVINQNTIEYLEADVSALLANTHTGASVKQYVNKYRRNFVVEVETIKSVEANQLPMSIDATTSMDDLLDESSMYFVDNLSMFTCSAEKDSGGNYKLIRFSQVGIPLVSDTNSPVTDADSARGYLISALGGQSNMTWADIVDATQKLVLDDTSAKSDLVSSINTYTGSTTVTNDSSWSTITGTTDSLIKDYKDALAGSVSGPNHSRSSVRILAGETSNLDFTPTVLIAKDNSGKESVWTSENGIGWISQEVEGIGISANVITYTAESGYVDIIIYN